MISTFMRLKQTTCGVFAKLRIWCLHFSFFFFSFPWNIMPWWLLWNRTITGAPLKEGDLTCCMAMAAVAYSKRIGKDWNFPWRRGNLQNPQFPHVGSTWQINRFLSHSCPPFSLFHWSCCEERDVAWIWWLWSIPTWIQPLIFLNWALSERIAFPSGRIWLGSQFSSDDIRLSAPLAGHLFKCSELIADVASGPRKLLVLF